MNAIQEAIKANNQEDAYNSFYQTMPNSKGHDTEEKHLASICDPMEVPEVELLCKLLILESVAQSNFLLANVASMEAMGATYKRDIKRATGEE